MMRKVEVWGEGLKDEEVMRLRGEIEYLECEAQAFRVLARLVVEYGLCNPDLQIARARPEQVAIDRDGEEMRMAVWMMVEDAIKGVRNT